MYKIFNITINIEILEHYYQYSPHNFTIYNIYINLTFKKQNFENKKNNYILDREWDRLMLWFPYPFHWPPVEK